MCDHVTGLELGLVKKILAFQRKFPGQTICLVRTLLLASSVLFCIIMHGDRLGFSCVRVLCQLGSLHQEYMTPRGLVLAAKCKTLLKVEAFLVFKTHSKAAEEL